MKKIFIIEDDDGIRELLQFILSTQNFEVKTFPNLRSFHAHNWNELPDLFLLDIMLPDGNGLDLCKEIKECGKAMKVPVLLMSAHANLKTNKCADDFIPKPFDVDELLQKLNTCLK